MSLEYDNYLRQHINDVVNAYEWLVRNINGANMFGVSQNYIWGHDESKFTSHEYDPYDEYFYGERAKDTKSGRLAGRAEICTRSSTGMTLTKIT